LTSAEEIAKEVEQVALGINLDTARLEELVEERQEQRRDALKALEDAILSGKQLVSLQEKEIDRLRLARCDEREDDEGVAHIDEILDEVTEQWTKLLDARSKTSSRSETLIRSINEELQIFVHWQKATELLTRISRIVDQRYIGFSYFLC